jgi:cytochrome c556
LVKTGHFYFGLTNLLLHLAFAAHSAIMEMKLILSLNWKEEMMKRNKYLSVVVCISFLTVLFLTGLSKNVRGEEGKATLEKKAGETSTKEKFFEEKQEFKRKAKERLDELDKKIDELEAKSKELGSKAKAEVKEDMQRLKKKRAALKKDMNKLEAKSTSKWEKAKQKIQDAEDELEKAYNKVRAKFTSD